MAEELDDSRFKTEVMRLLGNIISGSHEQKQQIDEVRSELGSKIGSVQTELSSLSAKVDVLSAQFRDVAVMSITDHQRIDDLGGRVNELEAKPH